MKDVIQKNLADALKVYRLHFRVHLIGNRVPGRIRVARILDWDTNWSEYQEMRVIHRPD